MTGNLCDRYRPKKLEQLVGQDNAVKAIQGLVKNGGVPHAMLFSGPPGCGKTTTARILAKRYLKCKPLGLQELNIGNLTTVDTIRKIEAEMQLGAMEGPVRVYILDETQAMRREAQAALLKPLEEPPDHVYFFLCTTDPQKLSKPIRSRCTKVRLLPVDADAMLELLKNVRKVERVRVSDDVLDKIVEVADGSARDALKYLETAAGIKDEEDQMIAVRGGLENAETKELARTLMDDRSTWANVRAVLKKLESEEPETVRRGVLGYVRAAAYSKDITGPRLERCLRIYNAFRDEMIQSGQAGFTQLVFAGLEVVGVR
jgi:DNA polymerase-3 subunit gamma/tau